MDRVEGLDQLRGNLKRLQDAASGAELGNAIRPGLEVIGALARRRVPVDTGELRDSMRVDLDEVGESTASGSVSFGTDHARRIEYGFLGKDKLGRRYHQPPRPYLRPAFDEGRDGAVGAIASRLTGGIRRAIR
jgi:HK97 gp10 family phage protein